MAENYNIELRKTKPFAKYTQIAHSAIMMESGASTTRVAHSSEDDSLDNKEV